LQANSTGFFMNCPEGTIAPGIAFDPRKNTLAEGREGVAHFLFEPGIKVRCDRKSAGLSLKIVFETDSWSCHLDNSRRKMRPKSQFTDF